jgi:hypothetical protein
MCTPAVQVDENQAGDTSSTRHNTRTGKLAFSAKINVNRHAFSLARKAVVFLDVALHAQRSDFPPETGELFSLLGRHTPALATINLGLPHPTSKRGPVRRRCCHGDVCMGKSSR